ncbi:hypothetical protein C8R42DRAFT_724234 [Lentinula raphanica]|nr:hypothetical protein C8R42DRAFT_724234 [Lentinula raphanica]
MDLSDAQTFYDYAHSLPDTYSSSDSSEGDVNDSSSDAGSDISDGSSDYNSYNSDSNNQPSDYSDSNNSDLYSDPMEGYFQKREKGAGEWLFASTVVETISEPIVLGSGVKPLTPRIRRALSNQMMRAPMEM